ncbi:hypothetical protein KKH05_00810 [Patescibacteria group bacterium]|nr:hypothetical protein [Patescibacteria group bacterium]
MKFKRAIILVSILLLFVPVNVSRAGLGISPSTWVEDHGMPGSHIEKIFTLSRGEPIKDLFFEAEVTGDIVDWISIDKGLEFTMPKGSQQFPITVTINVPQKAEHKNYKGEIRLKSTLKDNESQNVGVNVQALIQIDLTVAKGEFKDFEVTQISIPKQGAGKFVNVLLKIWNRGNVEAKPTRLEVTFWDKYKLEELATVEVSDFSAMKAIKPFSQGEITVKVPIELEPNAYWANVSVYDGDVLLVSEDIVFELLERGWATFLIAVKAFFGTTIVRIIGLIGLLLSVGFTFRAKLRSGRRK